MQTLPGCERLPTPTRSWEADREKLRQAEAEFEASGGTCQDTADEIERLKEKLGADRLTD